MMTPGERFAAEICGTTVRVTRREYDWVFAFGEDASLCVGSSWRLRNPECILLTDRDDGQKYGHPRPVDAEARANAILGAVRVISLTFDRATADIHICLSDEIRLDVLTNSSGYESWQAYMAGELEFVGRNGDG